MLESYEYFLYNGLYVILNIPVVVVGASDDLEGAYLSLVTPSYELSGVVHAGYSLVDTCLVTDNPEILRLPIVIYL